MSSEYILVVDKELPLKSKNYIIKTGIIEDSRYKYRPYFIIKDDFKIIPRSYGMSEESARMIAHDLSIILEKIYYESFKSMEYDYLNI